MTDKNHRLSGASLPDISDLLAAHGEGESAALKRVFSHVYGELRSRARKERARIGYRGTINTTGLVHEVYVKLASREGQLAVDRHHFLALAARAMRHLLVDHVRGRNRLKRGGDHQRTDRNPDEIAIDNRHVELMAVHQALDRLADVDPRLVQIVECRYFAGLSSAETAEAVQVSRRTVARGWKAAQAFLSQELQGDGVIAATD